MKNVSMRRFSLLGLVLLAASAVTAAIVPANKKANTANAVPNGSLTVSSDGQLSCSSTNGSFVTVCNDTPTGNGSATTEGEVASNNPSTVGDA